MCYCDGDGPTIYNHATRKGRKPYKCYECRRAIAAGEVHDVHSGLWDGEFSTFRWCVHCTAAQAAYAAITKDHCYCFGTLWESIREAMPGFGDVRDMAVCRLEVGARRKWRHRRGRCKGELMPVPVARSIPAVLDPEWTGTIAMDTA